MSGYETDWAGFKYSPRQIGEWCTYLVRFRLKLNAMGVGVGVTEVGRIAAILMMFKYEGQPASVGNLAEFLGLSLSPVRRLIATMEENGDVTVERSGRYAFVSLTPERERKACLNAVVLIDQMQEVCKRIGVPENT